MRTFELEQSDKEIASHAGLALIGAAIHKHRSLSNAIDAALPKRHGIPSSDMVKTYPRNPPQRSVYYALGGLFSVQPVGTG
ncbi:MAG: hypothetical protein GY726_13440, partial [Proteobacteria bacterium]|nr:hypothetical protein [Pseudomonadota bacterium]